MVYRTSRLVALLGVLALPAVCQEAGPTPAPEPTALDVADAAARSLDYEAAQAALSRASEGAGAEVVARIKQRQIVYERLLSLPALVEFGRQNPGAMIGLAITRDGRHLQGRIQALELGVTAGGAIGNRRLDQGGLALRLADDSIRTIPGPHIAQLSITWLDPDAPGGTGMWGIEKLRLVLHNGEVVEGKPTWLIPLCSLSVRAPGAAEDTDLSTFPGLDAEADVTGLVTELVLLGGPPVAPAPEAPVTPPGPVSGQPEETR
jgi:hypothetical protein